ncbi:phasin family protein [Planctomycetota bacterium]
MFEAIDKVMMAGLGALTMSKEKAEELFDEYVSKGEAAKEGRTGFVKEVMDSADKTRQELETMISDQIQKTVSGLHLASREDIARLEEKIDRLLAERG